MEIAWRDTIVDKIIQKHGVYPDEVEQCFDDPKQKIRRAQEGKYHLFARTDAGRYLFVVFVRAGDFLRVITARDMDDSERRYYRGK